MNLYAQSSAILAWLLHKPPAATVRQYLADGEIILASDLTMIECDRVLIRAAGLGELNKSEAADRRAHLANAANHWQIMRIAAEVVDRARLPFPDEPIRTLDAIYIASALTARAAVAGRNATKLMLRQVNTVSSR